MKRTDVEIVSCKILSNSLMEAMERKGISQEETARRTRMMTGRQLGRFIKDEHGPSLMRAWALSVVLDKPIDELFKIDVRTRRTIPQQEVSGRNRKPKDGFKKIPRAESI